MADQRHSERTLRELNPRGCALLIPLNAPDRAGLQTQAAQARGLADAVEVRLDQLAELPELIKNGDFAWLNQIREAASTPIIGTIRTAGQGGNCELDFWDYAEAVAELAKHCEFVDLEWDSEMPEPILQGLITAIQNGGAAVILSVHHWEEMPPMADVDSFFNKARINGVNIAKIAVMPDNLPQVAQLLQVLARNQNGPMETLAIAMGPLGSVSRAVGHLFGNCATFAALPGTEGSAPGQLPAERLAGVLDSLAGLIPPA
ncbi:hypothetical protein BSR29_07180 [Boudabousia liubingyangii]|uniref:3-dehydroquinate dehydratase n=1 Tax=Boudabousia liubingyangii TaxID=1921764 RepID=A0A1Q5PK56_9ACTO|nr:type I 3-dehydroquinate dehydratase [Boudabousia liubingyangii]OKL46598.1 hypothetical protein BSR29_07180 [Boudabousia liubingyangii]